jgi:hypothetical protein
MLAGPDDLVRGYRCSTTEEQEFTHHALEHHYLTLYARVFTKQYGIRERPNEPAMTLRMQLIGGPGSGTSKLSLDAALTESYSQGSLTRYMPEVWAQAAYVRIRPQEAY